MQFFWFFFLPNISTLEVFLVVSIGGEHEGSIAVAIVAQW